MLDFLIPFVLSQWIYKEHETSENNKIKKYCPQWDSKQNRSTEGCSKLKSPETVQVQEIGLIIRQLASPNMEQDQVSRGVSVLCWHAATIANVLWKPLAIRFIVKFGKKVKISNRVKIDVMPDQ